MCGRYEAGQKQKVAEAFHVRVDLDDVYFALGAECAPGSIQPVVFMRSGERVIGEMRWGFKFPERLVFNARSDNLTSSVFWRERLGQRCIVPASSMLEWKKTGTGPKPKYRLSLKGKQVFGMAGVWGPWKNPKTGLWEDTFAIITSDPNAKMSEIHDRQAIILEPREYAEWLEETERPPLHLLRTIASEDLVVDAVEAPREEPDSGQRGLFDGA